MGKNKSGTGNEQLDALLSEERRLTEMLYQRVSGQIEWKEGERIWLGSAIHKVETQIREEFAKMSMTGLTLPPSKPDLSAIIELQADSFRKS